MLPAPDYVSRAPWKYDIAPFEIADRLYYVGNTSVSAHLFDTGQGLLLLDTTYAETGYLRKETKVVLSVLSARQLSETMRAIHEVDENAFIIVNRVAEVYGRFD